jgi:S1-C subfamily serine protease
MEQQVMRCRTPKTLLAMSLAVALQASFSARGEESSADAKPWVAMAQLTRHGAPGGAAVYLGSGLVLTAAHLVDPGADMGVVLAGAKLPAKVLKQGVYEDIDLSLLMIDQSKLAHALPSVQLCAAPPWPGDPVIVIDAGNATRSKIAPPAVLSSWLRYRFSTLIVDVATTGNSGSGVFDPSNKCLLGIMSRKFTASGPNGTKDIAKYFVPVELIQSFMQTAELPKE